VPLRAILLGIALVMCIYGVYHIAVYPVP